MIDYLCPVHKAKVVELLKQLNEIRKRCGILESEIDAAGTGEQKLTQINADMAHKIEAEELRLLEATQISALARDQIESLTSEYERKETEWARLKRKVNETRHEVTTLNESYSQLRTKYDRLYQDTGETFHADTIDIGNQTEERRFADKECEAPPPESRSEVFVFEDPFDTPIWRSVTDQLDDETHSLILMLNNHF
jgi:chromosome segregation ATPase